MKKLTFATLTLLAAIGLPQAGFAGEPKPLSSKDMMFMKKAAAGGMFEVQAGECAQKMGMSDDVKTMGEHLVKDHSEANTQLMSLAKSKSVELPTKPSKMERSELETLKMAKGADFDKQFAAIMVKDHNEDIADFQKESEMTKDADLKEFVDKTVPVLKMHLQMAEKASGASK